MLKNKKSIDAFGDALKAFAEYVDKNNTSRHKVLTDNQAVSNSHRISPDVEFLATFSKNNTVLKNNK